MSNVQVRLKPPPATTGTFGSAATSLCMTDMPFPEPAETPSDVPAPSEPGEGLGPPPSDVPNALPGHPDPFTGGGLLPA